MRAFVSLPAVNRGTMYELITIPNALEQQKSGDTIVNIGGQKVETAAQKAAAAAKKPDEKKPKVEKPSDG